jgi:membrane protein
MPQLYPPTGAAPPQMPTHLKALRAAREFIALLALRFNATRCPQVAGSLTFTTLLALVPLVTVTIALFSNFPAFADLGTSLKIFLLENLLPERAGRIITTYALQFSEKAAGLTLIGTALLVVTALMLLSTIDRVFNQIWGVREPRPLLFRIAVYWFALTLGPLVLGGSVFASGYLVSASLELVDHAPWLSEMSARLLPPLMLGGLFSYLYFAVPNHPVRPLHALAGGIVAALAFLLMQRAFGMFIARFPTYTLVYGTFAALPIFLVWLYMSWVIVLLGALIAAILPSFLDRTRVVPAFCGDQTLGALNMLICLAKAQEEGHPADFSHLRNCARLADDQCEFILGKLRDAGWAVRSEEGHWVLSARPEHIGLAAIIERFALSTTAMLAACPSSAGRGAIQRMAEALQSADLSLADLLREESPPPQVG